MFAYSDNPEVFEFVPEYEEPRDIYRMANKEGTYKIVRLVEIAIDEYY